MRILILSLLFFTGLNAISDEAPEIPAEIVASISTFDPTAQDVADDTMELALKRVVHDLIYRYRTRDENGRLLDIYRDESGFFDIERYNLFHPALPMLFPRPSAVEACEQDLLVLLREIDR